MAAVKLLTASLSEKQLVRESSAHTFLHFLPDLFTLQLCLEREISEALSILFTKETGDKTD